MLLDVGALGASTVSACCLLGSPRPVRVWVSAGLMVLAMAGCVLASAAPGVGLLSMLLSLASAGFALHRRGSRVPPMSLHRALGGVTMAAVVAMSLGMPGSHGAAVPAQAQAQAHAHVHASSFAVLAASFVAGYLAYSAWLLVTMARAGLPPSTGEASRGGRAGDTRSVLERVRSSGGRSLLEVGEVAGMAVGVALMAVM